MLPTMARKGNHMMTDRPMQNTLSAVQWFVRSTTLALQVITTK